MIPLQWQKVKRNLRAYWWRWKRRVKNLQHSKNKDHGIWPYHFMANKSRNSVRFHFPGLQNQCSFGKIAMTNLGSVLKSRDHFANKDPYSQSYGFSSSHVWMWELDHKEGWAPKNWCFWTVVLGKILESPLDSKEIKSVNPKENQPWIFIGRKGDETEAPATWCKEPIHWKWLWYWERLRARREGDGRGWDGWTASPTQWTWVWANSGRWRRTGNPGMLQFMGSQRTGHDLATEQQQHISRY